MYNAPRGQKTDRARSEVEERELHDARGRGQPAWLSRGGGLERVQRHFVTRWSTLRCYQRLTFLEEETSSMLSSLFRSCSSPTRFPPSLSWYRGRSPWSFCSAVAVLGQGCRRARCGATFGFWSFRPACIAAVDVAALVAEASAWLLLLVTLHFALCSLRQSTCCQADTGALTVDYDGTFMSGCWRRSVSRAVFLSVVVRPGMLGIMASLDQKGSYAARCSPA